MKKWSCFAVYLHWCPIWLSCQNNLLNTLCFKSLILLVLWRPISPRLWRTKIGFAILIALFPSPACLLLSTQESIIVQAFIIYLHTIFMHCTIHPPTLLYVFIWFSSIETRFIISILRLNCIECPQYVARTARAETVVVKLTTLKVSDTTIKWQRFFSLRLLCVPRHLRLDTIAVNRQIELSSLRCICQAQAKRSHIELLFDMRLNWVRKSVASGRPLMRFPLVYITDLRHGAHLNIISSQFTAARDSMSYF